MRDVAAFTGHRDLESYEDRTIELLEQWIGSWKESKSDVWALVGGAAGTDTLAALACYRLGVSYTVCLPDHGYSRLWIEMPIQKGQLDPKWLGLHQQSLELASKVVYIDSSLKYTKGNNFKRNLYMLKYASRLCAVKIASKQSSGTDHTISSAKKRNITLDILDPSIL